MAKTKIKQLLAILSPDKTSVAFDDFVKGTEKLKEKLEDAIRADTMDEVRKELSTIKKNINVDSAIKAIEELRDGVSDSFETLSSAIEVKLSELERYQSENSRNANQSQERLTKELMSLRDETKQLIAKAESKLEKLNKDFGVSVQTINLERGKDIESVKTQLLSVGQNTLKAIEEEKVARETGAKELSTEIKKLRTDVFSRTNHGGNANRNIAISGNTSVLSRYTDINLKPGSNVSFSYQNNDVTKMLDLTITATGGGGSVIGTTRSINRVNTSQTMGGATNTDYVYIATDGVAVTLPDANTNTNLYTVKNVGVSSVLILTTSAQTIDGDTSLILGTQFTSVDIVNDGNNNWSIT